jgi:glycine cleavage system H protein
MWSARIVMAARGYRFFSLKYTTDHEWVKYDAGTQTGTIGITDYAQQQLGDVVHISLPKINHSFKQKDVMSTIESVKVVSDIYAPISCTVTSVNQKTEKNPEIINQGAESDGWLFQVKVQNLKELDSLLDKSGYEKFLKESGH